MPILCGTYYPSENENRVAPPRIEPAPSADLPALQITAADRALGVARSNLLCYLGISQAGESVAALSCRERQLRESAALLAEVSETLLGTRDGSHEQIRAALLAYRNAEETAYYDAQECKEREEPRAGDE